MADFSHLKRDPWAAEEIAAKVREGQKVADRIILEALTDRRQYLFLFTLASRAALGDLKAQNLLIPLIMQVFGAEDRTTKSAMSAADQALLEELLGGNHPGDVEPSDETSETEEARTSPDQADSPSDNDELDGDDGDAPAA